MTSLARPTVLALAFAVLTGATAVQTGKQTVPIRPSDVSAKAEADKTVGQYYTVEYSLPEGLKSDEVERAVLELYVNVRAKIREDYVNEAPMLEVYAPTEALTGSIELKKLDVQTRGARPVTLGDRRHVRIDITKIVRARLAGGVEDHGLVLGSLSGMREGDFTIVPNMFSDGSVARLSIYLSSKSR